MHLLALLLVSACSRCLEKAFLQLILTLYVAVIHQEAPVLTCKNIGQAEWHFDACTGLLMPLVS